MTIGGDSGELCFSLNEIPSLNLAYAVDRLVNESDKPLDVVAFHAVNAQNVRASEAYVAPVPNPGTLIGAANTWPAGTTKEPIHTAAWQKRQPLGGYVLPAHSENTSYNLVVHLIVEADTKSASLDSLQVDYRADGKIYRAATSTRVVLKPSCL